MELITLGLLVKIAFALSVADDLADVKKKLWETTGEVAGVWLDNVLNRLPRATRQAMKAAESQIKAHQTMLRLDESRQAVAITIAGHLLRDHAPSATDIVQAAYDAPTLTAQTLRRGRAVLAEIDGMQGENEAVEAVLTILLGHALTQANSLQTTESLWRELIQKRQDDILAHLRRLPDDLFLRYFSSLTLLRRNAPQNIGAQINAAEMSASELLTARHTTLSLLGREREMETLLAWANTKARVGVRLITGPGGHGKTRLALELCRRLEQQGWRTGFLVDRLPDLCNIQLADLFDETVPTLITIDYAAGRMGDLQRFADLAAEWAASGRFRLLLVEREAGDWWTTNRKSLHDPAGTLLRGPACLAEPLEVPALPIGIPAEVFTEAASHFAPLLGVPVDQVQTPGIWPDDLGLPLFARARALLAVEAARDGTKPPAATQDDILDHLLFREQRVWRAAARLTADDNAKLDDICTIVTLLTLSAPTHRNDAPALVRRLPALANHSGETLKQWLTALHPLYGDGDLLRGLEPDLLGEHLVWRTVTSPTDPLLTTATGPDASEAQAQTALTVLNRLAARKPGAVEWLRTTLDRDFDHLAVPAFRVALEQPLPMADLFRAVMGRLKIPDALAVAKLLPDDTTELLEIAAHIEQFLANNPKSTDTEKEIQSFRAHHLGNLACRLGKLGKHEEALSHSRESAKIYYSLNNEYPGEYTPDLAMALNNLGNHLAELGLHEEAFEKSELSSNLYRRLIAEQRNKFLSMLAMALVNMSDHLSSLGQIGAALTAIEEAAEFYQSLAKERPETFLPYLAAALCSLASRQSQMGQEMQALCNAKKGAEIYSALVERQPDAFLPEKAKALNNIAVFYSKCSQWQDALAAAKESTAIYCSLSKRRPATFSSGLAMALHTLSHCLSNAGHRQRALTVIKKAVSIRRRLAKEFPEAFIPDLSSSISELGYRLREMERFDEALVAAREALVLLYPFFRKLPLAHGGNIARYVYDCIEAARAAGQEPDKGLLHPIVIALIQ